MDANTLVQHSSPAPTLNREEVAQNLNLAAIGNCAYSALIGKYLTSFQAFAQRNYPMDPLQILYNFFLSIRILNDQRWTMLKN